MEELEQLFSANLKLMRLRLSLSQEELASSAGVDRSYLSQVECGVKSPTLRFISKISTALGCSPQTLFLKEAVNDE